jgi:hypothetical protein
VLLKCIGISSILFQRSHTGPWQFDLNREDFDISSRNLSLIQKEKLIKDLSLEKWRFKPKPNPSIPSWLNDECAAAVKAQDKVQEIQQLIDRPQITRREVVHNNRAAGAPSIDLASLLTATARMIRPVVEDLTHIFTFLKGRARLAAVEELKDGLINFQEFLEVREMMTVCPCNLITESVRIIKDNIKITLPFLSSHSFGFSFSRLREQIQFLPRSRIRHTRRVFSLKVFIKVTSVRDYFHLPETGLFRG